MKKKLKTMLLLAFLLTIFSFTSYTVFAQPTGDNDYETPDNPVPIDGGLLLLLSAGAGYGIKKYKNAKENRSTNE